MTNEPTYRGFLTYSHVDRAWARWLHRALEAYRPPRHLKGPDGDAPTQRLVPIFRDRDELPTSASLSAAVTDALQRSETLIVICSPQAAASRWVNEEIRTFRKLGKSDRIFCCIVDGEPHSGGLTECFPPALLESAAPGDAPAEPIAADARPSGDGKRNALLKIAAGMLGVGFDALRQRDLHRRHRQLAGLAGGSLLIAAVTISLAVMATIARNDAEVRRAQAEDLIEFMLGDLQVRLHEIGRLDVYESVGDKALEYFASLREEDVSNRMLFQRGKNLQQIGEVRMESGDLGAALEAFEESNLIYERLALRGQNDAEWQIALATSYFWIGYIHWQRGDLPLARREFQKVLPIVDAVSSGDPDNTGWLLERGYAHTNLGRILELEGSLNEALVAYQTVMEINQRLLELEPDNTDWQLEVGYAHNNIGKLVYSLGRLAEAESHYREDLAIKSDVFELNPQHNFQRADRGASSYFLGRALLSSGSYVEAEANLLVANKDFDLLIAVEPDRLPWRARQASIERVLGNLYARTGRLDQAEQKISASINAIEQLLSLEAANVGWRRNHVNSLLSAAEIDARSGRVDDAAKHLRTARKQLVVLHDQEPTNRETLVLAMRADIDSAMLLIESDSVKAEAAFRASLEKLRQDFPATTDPLILDMQANALAALGEEQQASGIYLQLAAMGYKNTSRP